MTTTLRKLYALLTAQERRSAALLFLMMLVMGLLEAVGVASVMPFIAVLSNPSVIRSNTQLSYLYDAGGFESQDGFLIFLGAAMFVLVVGSLAFKALTYWALARYTHMRSFSLSDRMLSGYLERPYSYFLGRHSADMGKSILSEVGQVVSGVMMPVMMGLANLVVVAFLLLLVVMVEPVVAVVSITLLGGAYSLVYSLLRQYLTRIGAERLAANQERFTVAQEVLGGIKDVKVRGVERAYIESFRRPAKIFARRLASGQVVSDLPRFVLEAIAFGGILLALLYLLVSREGSAASVFPVMAVYAFAAARLVPALQKVYVASAKLRFGGAAVEALYHDLQSMAPASASLGGETVTEKLSVRNGLQLNDVYYSYPSSEAAALRGVSLKIRARTTVGIVGRTGAGKTTVVDVILGLLTPDKGELFVDNVRIESRNVRAWQRNIGYVPQSIFLSDGSIAENIAFGTPVSEIDMKAVKRAAQVAGIDEFVEGSLPKQYSSLVGERGVRLSGGQRQRIGIARALYLDPQILVFDEATSALDPLTEKAVMDALRSLGGQKTIILIAHRLSTVKSCDEIFMLEEGRVVQSGTYNALAEISGEFRRMAGL